MFIIKTVAAKLTTDILMLDYSAAIASAFGLNLKKKLALKKIMLSKSQTYKVSKDNSCWKNVLLQRKRFVSGTYLLKIRMCPRTDFEIGEMTYLSLQNSGNIMIQAK